MKIRKNDKVQIIKGKDRVKKDKKSNQGKVIQTLPSDDKIVVEGLNLRFKHLKPKREGEKGERIQMPAPIKIENVMLVCPKCHKATRVGYKVLNTDVKGNKKVRICKKCKEVID